MFSKIKFLIYICSACLLIQVAKSQSCNITTNYSYFGDMVCRDIIGQFPIFLDNVKITKCINCNITVIDEHIMPDKTVVRLRMLNLSNSNVHTITSNAFKAYSNITQSLIFENNNINFIGEKTFSKFNMLSHISLKNNNITGLNKGVFEGTSVMVMDLSFNSLTNISLGFEGLRVAKLNLSNNHISAISERIFDQTTFWIYNDYRLHRYSTLNYKDYPLNQYLDLSYNLIYKIVPNTLQLNGVRELYLQGNKMTTIENEIFSNSTTLTSLNLADNTISTTYNDSFKGLKQLKTLDLSRNSIETFPLGIFGDLNKLTVLDLAENKITVVEFNTFSGLIQLSLLNISYNNLRVIDGRSLSPLGSLKSLDISDNKLTSLNIDDLLKHHYKLEFLAINDNFWTCKDLFKMYKTISNKTGGFNRPSQHFEVPNLHGIACSNQALSNYEDMTIQKFLEIISEDRPIENLFDSNPRENGPSEREILLSDLIITVKRIYGIFYMISIISILVVILFLQFIVRCAFRFLYRHKILSTDKFSYMYARNDKNVELVD